MDETVTKLNNIKIEMDPDETYCATDNCNPLTARLIILFNETICPFIKDEFIKNSHPKSQNKRIKLAFAFYWFCLVIFSDNLQSYNLNELNWLKEKIKTIEKLTQHDTPPSIIVVLLQELLRGVDNQIITKSLRDIISEYKGEIGFGVDIGFSDDNTLVSPHTDLNLFLLFIEFTAIVKNYYFNYYSEYLISIAQYTPIDLHICYPIKIRIYLYTRPVNATTYDNIRNVINTTRQQQIETHKINPKIYGTYAFLSRNMDYPRFRSWDAIFKNSGLFNINFVELDNVQRITPETYCNTSDTQSPPESRVNTATHSQASINTVSRGNAAQWGKPQWGKPQKSNAVQQDKQASPSNNSNRYRQSSQNAQPQNAQLMNSRGGAKTTHNHISENNNTPQSKNITYPKKKKMHNKSYRKRRAN